MVPEVNWICEVSAGRTSAWRRSSSASSTTSLPASIHSSSDGPRRVAARRRTPRAGAGSAPAPPPRRAGSRGSRRGSRARRSRPRRPPCRARRPTSRGAVERVHRHDHHARVGGAELHLHPLRHGSWPRCPRARRGSNPAAISARAARARALAQLLVGPARRHAEVVVGRVDERLAVGPFRGRLVEQVGDRQLAQLGLLVGVGNPVRGVADDRHRLGQLRSPGTAGRPGRPPRWRAARRSPGTGDRARSRRRRRTRAGPGAPGESDGSRPLDHDHPLLRVGRHGAERRCRSGSTRCGRRRG